MITGIGSVGTTRAVDLQGATPRSSEAVQAAASQAEAVETPRSPAAALAAQGAPVDTDKVAAIRASIAAGTYKIDPKAIAGAMVAQDLAVRA
ncbi:flagellar biosynthesis anti-sigma factor FlgM [Sphingomonas nostoxanthinifaciens]|uniref:flagellar biosynthesis anti-sigma factor FlgM n=1 Tax=Sphingomonas nostoxanthinifaciens TaxID=2872652 RepID=UPI001CC20C4B|nr:flagellar biosynthesis anti-sigma factor FlgM [Sphingomonas nostoxanthinifaciens]UAK26051.1 flagellar biosynthesis anti-sigma factor FlgM [Sphingomonas nostoxanthinifaciens]